MNDISNRTDVGIFVKSFYRALLSDADMKHFFIPIVANGQLDKHLQTIVDFWHDILFLSADYRNNAMKPHMELHKKQAMTSAHFSAWLAHFNQTMDQLFCGTKADLAKTSALSIATIMQIKLRDL